MIYLINDTRPWHLDIGKDVVVYKRIIPFVYRRTGKITQEDVASKKTKTEMSNYFNTVFK
jgi:hypothetical protein